MNFLRNWTRPKERFKSIFYLPLRNRYLCFVGTRAEAGVARPLPAGGRPKPQIRKPPQIPKVRALYDYTAQDQDEISLVAGEVLELVQEGGYNLEIGVIYS